jgi:hypothetical protein
MHNVLSKADSQLKVQKEKEYIENKRVLKEKEKRFNTYKKRFAKLLDNFKEAKMK